MDFNIVPYAFWIVLFAIGSCCCIDQLICKPCIKKIKNNPRLFTPTHTPTQPPNSPASSDTSSIEDLPSPATMKPDYSSGEDYIDIYREYIRSNSHTSNPYENDCSSHDPESP